MSPVAILMIPVVIHVLIMFSFLALDHARRQIVKGTHLSYVAKTWAILLTIASIVNLVPFTGCMLYLIRSSTVPSAIVSCACAFMLFISMCDLRKLLYDDDEDSWFTDRRKKIKRWMNDVRTSFIRKPVPVRF